MEGRILLPCGKVGEIVYTLPEPYTNPFLLAAKSPNREIDTRITLTFSDRQVELTTTEVASYKITKSSTAGSSFSPGSFVAGQLEVSLVASSPVVERLNFKNTPLLSLSVKAGIHTSKGMAYVPLGVFYPVKDGITLENDGYIKVSALDTPQVLSEQFRSETWVMPCTVSEALDHISQQTGLTFSARSEDLPNLGVTLSETFSLITTYREAIMYVVEILGACAHMGREGEVRIEKMFGAITNLGGVLLNEDYLYSADIQESTVKPYQYIGIKANQDDLGMTHEVSGVSTECQYDIIDNPLTYGHPEDFLEGLVTPLSFSEFHPSKVSFHGRPDIDVGDVITYVHKGVEYLLPVCTHTFEYGGGFKTTLESIGSDTLKSSSADSGPKSKLTALKQNINMLIRDLTQTQSQIIEINGDITEMSNVLQTVEALQTQVSKIEGDLTNITTLTQTAENLKLSIESINGDLKNAVDQINANQKTLLTYFDFAADGLTIGVNNSKIKLKLINDMVYFVKDDNVDSPVAYFSDEKLYVTDAHFLHSMVLGSFEISPRANGNLSIRRRV